MKVMFSMILFTLHALLIVLFIVMFCYIILNVIAYLRNAGFMEEQYRLNGLTFLDENDNYLLSLGGRFEIAARRKNLFKMLVEAEDGRLVNIKLLKFLFRWKSAFHLCFKLFAICFILIPVVFFVECLVLK